MAVCKNCKENAANILRCTHDSNDKFHSVSDRPACVIKIEVMAGWTVPARNYIRKQWMRHGELHRLEGPAVIDSDTDIVQYWINGQPVEKKEHDKEVARLRSIEK